MRVAAASGGGGGNDASGAGSSTQQAKSSSSSDASGPDPGLGLKAVWFGAEAFGNLIGGGSAQQQQRRAAEQQQLTREAAIAAIKEDYESNVSCSAYSRYSRGGDLQA